MCNIFIKYLCLTNPIRSKNDKFTTLFKFSYAFAMFWKRANRTGVILSAVLGFVGNVLFYVYEYHIAQHAYKPAFLADTYLGYIIIGIVGSLAGLLIGNALGARSTEVQLATVSTTPLEGVEVFDISKE